MTFAVDIPGEQGFVSARGETAPTTHFVALSQAILFRGAGVEVVWPQFTALILIGTILFLLAHSRFRKTISLMA